MSSWQRQQSPSGTTLRHGFAIVLILAACVPLPADTTVPAVPTTTATAAATVPAVVTELPSPTPTPRRAIPEFRHIVLIVFENKEFGSVVGNSRMPYFNRLAREQTLLTQHYAVAHPSLPNYLAMISGDTFGLDFNCTKCLYDALTLPDLIEQSGRSWRTYQEDMPSPCYQGTDYGLYAMKHNPFLYFESIRLDRARCEHTVVPLTQLYADVGAQSLPNFAFIKPNLCNDSHDCELDIADAWLESLMLMLLPELAAAGDAYLVIVTWEEGQGDHSCCGLPPKAGGRVPTVLVSSQGRKGFEDSTAYSHYSILKTIAESWQLPYLGHAADAETALILAPWQ